MKYARQVIKATNVAFSGIIGRAVVSIKCWGFNNHNSCPTKYEFLSDPIQSFFLDIHTFELSKVLDTERIWHSFHYGFIIREEIKKTRCSRKVHGPWDDPYTWDRGYGMSLCLLSLSLCPLSWFRCCCCLRPLYPCPCPCPSYPYPLDMDMVDMDMEHFQEWIFFTHSWVDLWQAGLVIFVLLWLFTEKK